jgi:hypothetical protein
MKSYFTLILAITGTWYSAVCRPFHFSGVSPEFAQFRSNLYAVGGDGSASLMDGTLTQYDTGYSNNVDGYDARKLANPNENLAMIRGTSVLIIERRKTFQNNDTIFFKMWNMRPITYQLQLIAYHLNTPGRIGIIKDNYLKTDTPISLDDTTNFSFTVSSDPASYATNRFMVVFETPSLSVLPLTITSFSTQEQKSQVKIDWTTYNESGMKQYKIERSLNGNDFMQISDVPARNDSYNNYEFIDRTAVSGYNLYRVESVTKDGQSQYSPIAKIYIGKENTGRFSIFPNPVINNNLNLKMENLSAGKYEIRLLNTVGQLFWQKNIDFAGGSASEKLRIQNKIPKGIYRLEIKSPSGAQKLITVLFE